MNDLISRQVAIEALDTGLWGVEWDKALATAILKDLPSAQPEIIMCKDCKHRDAEEGFCEGRGWPMQLVPDYGFCDKGERSEDEEP